MKRRHKRSMREVTLAVVAVALFWWMLTAQRWETAAAHQTGTLADFFTGPPPSVVNSDEVAKARVRLEPGARAHWHSHGWGQLLLPEEGRGRFQIRNQPLQELRPGEPVFTGGGVVHWHGAAPDQSLVMIAMQGGGAEWMEPVNDEVYLAQPAR